MTDDLERLLEGKLDGKVRRVLGAALHDGPSPESLRAAARTLGLSPGVAQLARATTAPHAAVTAKSLATSGLLKWLGIIFLLGGVAVTLAPAREPPRITVASRPRGEPPSPHPDRIERRRAVPAVPAERPQTAAPVVSPAQATSATSLSDENSATQTRRAEDRSKDPSRSRAPALDSNVKGVSLGDETAMLDRARRALRAGDAQAALASLERYDAAPSRHVLRSEALLLRVRALATAGRRAEACALVGDVSDRPDESYAEQLKAFCTEPPPAPHDETE